MRARVILIALALLLAAGAAEAQDKAQAPAEKPSLLRDIGRRFGDSFRSLFGAKPEAQEEREEYYIRDQKTFDENTRKIHMRPFNNQNLEFDIRLPRNWTWDDLVQNKTQNAVQTGIAGDLMTFQSEMIGVHRIQGSVALQLMKHEVSAKNWLKDFILSSGYALQDDVAEDGPNKAAAHYTYVGEKGTTYSYITVRIMRSFIFVSRVDAPLALQHVTDYLQKNILDTLRISYPLEGRAEEQKRYIMSDAIRFEYPQSWQILHPESRDVSRLSILLETRSATGSVDGFIRFLAVRRSRDTDLQKELALQREHFPKVMGISIQKYLDERPLNVSNRFLFKRYEVYAAGYETDNAASTAYQTQEHTLPEIHYAVLGDKSWYIFAYMITPKEHDNLASWGRNVRTFDLILESIK